VVDAHAVQQRAGDRFLAASDGADRRAADQVDQAADHPAGALAPTSRWFISTSRRRLMWSHVGR